MNDFEDVLEQCLNKIASGESTVEECLARYPKYSLELQPFLIAATELKMGRDITPSPFFKARLRSQLTQKIQSSSRPARRFPAFFSRMAVNVAVLLLAFVATSTVFAQSALPGEALYNWKLTSERVWRSISADPVGTDLRLSDRRINEYVAVSKDETRRARVLNGYHDLLIRFETEKDPAERARILLALRAHQDALKKAGLSIPELDDYVIGVATKSDGALPIATPGGSAARPTPKP